ncbi:imidazole glycerol phosphate synthase cyclase subunit [Candidatus Pelagibacter bacterium]|nr:imidazole glycerol phosphate synthase cyclase subunit [Candidatus Pelagibacter bacterium]
MQIKKNRLIARLDIKGENLIKGINLEGLRVIGSPNEYAKKYYSQGADELIFIDTVASLYGRNHLGSIIKSAAQDIFIPITVGGGIRSLEDALNVLRVGADKIAVNTAAVNRPELISEISNTLGSQSVVLSVEAKKIKDNKWEVYIENGRESTGVNVMEWIKRGEICGAGEILLTSIDRDGTGRGFDLELIKLATESVTIPVIASGGIGTIQDVYKAITHANTDAIAMAYALHYDKTTFNEIRKKLNSYKMNVRNFNINE